MDQKRTIIIILSICVVAIVVTGVALWLLYPRANTGVANTAGTPATFVQGLGPSPAVDAIGQNGGVLASPLPGTNGQPLVQPSPGASPATGATQVHNSNEVVIVYGTNPTYRTGPDGTLIRVDGNQPNANVIPLPSAQPTTGPATNLGNIGQAATPAPTAAPSPKPAASSAPRVSNTNATQSNPKPSAAPARVSGKEFWIQIISSPNRDRVDQVKHDLAALGFNGRVTTKSVSGSDYFRLRYGPYSRSDEAQKFLDWVKAIRGFEQSYIAEEFPQPAK